MTRGAPITTTHRRGSASGRSQQTCKGSGAVSLAALQAQHCSWRLCDRICQAMSCVEVPSQLLSFKHLGLLQGCSRVHRLRRELSSGEGIGAGAVRSRGNFAAHRLDVRKRPCSQHVASADAPGLADCFAECLELSPACCMRCPAAWLPILLRAVVSALSCPHAAACLPPVSSYTTPCGRSALVMGPTATHLPWCTLGGGVPPGLAACASAHFSALNSNGWLIADCRGFAKSSIAWLHKAACIDSRVDCFVHVSDPTPDMYRI